MTSPLACLVCGGERTREAMVATNGYPILECADCGTLVTDRTRMPDPSTLYPPFDQSPGAAMGAVRRLFSVFLRRRLAVVREVKPSGRLLDFGCGAGAFARFAAQSGYEVVGLEPFSLGAERTEGSLRLIHQPLEAAKAALGSFDVITLWHVLEHLTEPVATLRVLAGLLAPGGAFVISVPNAASLQGRAFGGGWFHLDPPRHLIHFTPPTLEACLGRAGLKVERQFPFQPEYGISGWVQSGVNQVLPRKNFLYEVVKDRGALAGTGLLENVGHAAVSLALGTPLALLSFPLEAVAARDNRAAAITVSARPA